MTTLSFDRKVVEETGRTNREAVKRATAVALHALRDRQEVREEA